jgi:PAS domain-containing protein
MAPIPQLAIAEGVVPWWFALAVLIVTGLAIFALRPRAALDELDRVRGDLQNEITRGKQLAGELRMVARSANCFLWHAAVKEEGGEFRWDLRIFTEALDEFVEPARLPPGSRAHVWYHGRVEEELVKLGDNARGAMRADRPGYRQEFRCRDAAGQEVWFAEDVKVERAGPNAWKLVGVSTDVTERRKAEAEVKQLSGLLPICSSCKKVRDDAGYWRQIEVYIRNRAAVQFSHGLCPDCRARLYPGVTE